MNRCKECGSEDYCFQINCGLCYGCIILEMDKVEVLTAELEMKDKLVEKAIDRLEACKNEKYLANAKIKALKEANKALKDENRMWEIGTFNKPSKKERCKNDTA